MISISRSDKSKILDITLDKIMKEASFGIERLSYGIEKEDPFKGLATDDVWYIVKGKLIRNNKRAIKCK